MAPQTVERPARRVVRHLGADDRSSQRVRVVDAALRRMATHGLRKTTLDDVAREAGMSRATLYRTFPGGRRRCWRPWSRPRPARFFSGLAVVMGEAHDLEDVLVAGMVEAARRLSGHRALAYLLTHEPEVVSPWMAFGGMDRLCLGQRLHRPVLRPVARAGPGRPGRRVGGPHRAVLPGRPRRGRT